MKNKKIQFVLAESEVNSVYAVGWSPPLAFLSIATYFGSEIELLDSQIMSQNEIEEKLDCDILAGSINLFNYKNFLKIAQRCKEKNPKCRIIVGGPHSFLAENILKNRPYIDAVVIGDGEKTFTMYAKDEDLSKIPNLVYRKDGKIIFNPKEYLDLDDLPIPDRKYLSDLKPYFKNFKGEFSKPTTMYSQKGCFWGKCLFCCVKPPMRSRKPEPFWQEVKYLQNNYGIDYIWDVSDSLDKKRFEGLYQTKSKDINVKLRFFVRTSEIDKETVKTLKDLNCYEVFLGIETGDPNLLQLINKNSSLQQHLRAVELLVKEKIKPRTSFVFGLPGENEKTLKNTYSFIQQLINCGADSIACSILVPVPGSEAFKMMLEKQEFHKKYATEDLFDIQTLQKDWVNSFCNVDYEVLTKIIRDFERLCPEKFYGGFSNKISS